MHWNEKKNHQTQSTVVDLSFDIRCKMLPVDHAYALSTAIAKALPWFDKASNTALHLIHGAESGNGWQKPDTSGDDNPCLYLSRRSKLTLRLPTDRIEAANQLNGVTLDLQGYPCEIGKSKSKPLSVFPILFSRYIISDEHQSEEDLIEHVYQSLKAMNIECSKMMCGRIHYFQFPNKKIFTRSLMIADLDPDASLTLLQQGFGQGTTFGCGIFLPHKDIKPVQQALDQQ